MKASQVIRAALTNYYGQGRRVDFTIKNRTAFMCHAVEFELTDGICDVHHENFDLIKPVINTFMLTLQAGGCGTLFEFLNKNDVEYKEAYKSTGSHYSIECFQIRVMWWNAHIAALQAKGL